MPINKSILHASGLDVDALSLHVQPMHVARVDPALPELVGTEEDPSRYKNTCVHDRQFLIVIVL